MIGNFNIGLLGHVDSGKTTLARALSAVASTAAFDKNPQSQERGITLDLGFSGLLIDAPERFHPRIQQLQMTFVDCPGHASLIRTIIGGAQIIDLMLLVIDAQKGIQTQTAECIVIGELLQKRLIVVINKTDLLEETTREKQLAKLTTKLQKTLAATSFGGKVEIPIFRVCALDGANIETLLAGICNAYESPRCDVVDEPLFMYVDHCFSIKGQGTVCTGTIMQGRVSVHDTVELPALGEQRKVKSMQMFRRPVETASKGDRVGICVTQFNAKLMERGVLAQTGFLKPIYAVCIRVNSIPYYKSSIKSKSKFHIVVGHETVMGSITLFKSTLGDNNNTFNQANEYEYLEEIPDEDTESRTFDSVYALIELEKSVLTTAGSPLIASKLDMDVHSSSCRLAFWGNIEWLTQNPNYTQEVLPQWRLFKIKEKQGTIQRVVNEREVIVQNLFKKVTNRDMYVGKRVELSTGEIGQIESTFGQTSKVRICFRDALNEDTLNLLKTGRSKEVTLLLKYKKYIFNKNAGVCQ